jgi:acyl carrier protein
MPDAMPTQKPSNPEAEGPLALHTEQEIEHLLRGFSDASVAGALGLRTGSQTSDFETCLYGILFFYRPAGSEELDADPSGQTRLREDLGLDSLAMLEAMFKVEELFDIHIDNAELTTIYTIDDARHLLEEKLQSRGST